MIDHVAEVLVSTLRDRMPGQKVALHALLGSDPPPEQNTIAVTLISIDAREDVRNRPDVLTADGYRKAPLLLQLLFMITYGKTEDATESLRRLSLAAQVLHTVDRIPASDLPEPLSDRVLLRFAFRNLTLDERQLVFAMLGRDARPALFYEVDAALIDVLEPEGYGTVTAHEVQYVTKGSP